MEKEKNNLIEKMFGVGAHFGFVKSRRHPSVKSFIFGSKNKIEIFDLEKTSRELINALSFVESKAKNKSLILFVGGKSEAREAVRKAGGALDMPFVDGRWIGGTLTNFSEIKKRIGRLEELNLQREKGELAKYTKKERLLIDREIDRLELYFGGLRNLKNLPKILVVIDPKKEHIAITEAKRMNIPVVSLAGSDADLTKIDFPIPGNDASRQTIGFIIDEIIDAYKKGLKESDKPVKNNSEEV